VSSHEGDLSLAFGDIGVLFRINAQGDALEEALDRAGIPFVRSGERPLIGQYPVNIISRFFQTLQNPENTFYAKTYAGVLAETGKKMPQIPEGFHRAGPLPDLIDEAATLHGCDLSKKETLLAMKRLKELAGDFKKDMQAFLDTLTLERGIDHAILAGDRVALMSLHSAKGLEWPVVFVTGCEDQLLPCTLFGARDDEEERRLLYVGMSRARHRLILSYVTRRVLNGRVLNMNPSPFLETIPVGLRSHLERRAWKHEKKPQKQLNLFSD
jgi:superfamily I DNA/RNA helicase